MVPRDQENRLVVKLKLPKMSEKEEEKSKVVEIIEGEELTKKSHYCAECKRSFSSGKALGGHMSSAHVQANKDLSLKKLKSKLKKHHMGSASSSMGFICNICGKDFPSRKSVFGHMRCHPDREWRGMEPPRRMKIDSMEEAENYDDEEVDEEHDQVDSGPDLVSGPAVDLSETLKSWTVRARRGSNQADPELLNAVHQLIRLVNDDWDKSKVEDLRSNSHKELELSDHKEENRACGSEKKQKFEDVSLMKLKMSEESAIDYEEKIDDDTGEKKASFQGLEPLKSEDDDEYDYKNILSAKRKQTREAKCCTKTQKKPKIAMDLDDKASEFASVKMDSPIPTTPGKFSCNICKKRFATHQALGGHRSSHNKFKISIHNASDHLNQESQKEKYCANSTTTTTTAAAATTSSATTNELGSRIKDDQMSPAVDDGYVSTARKGIAFDLNEMPDTEEDYM